MSDRLIKTETLADIAEAIREKKETADPIRPSAFAAEIRSIEATEEVEAYDDAVTVDEGVTPTFTDDYSEGYADGVAEGIEQGKFLGVTTPTDNRTTMRYWYQYLLDGCGFEMDYETGAFWFSTPVEELEWPKGTQNVTDFTGILSVLFMSPYGYGQELGLPVVKMVGELDCSSVNRVILFSGGSSDYCKDLGKFINTGHITDFYVAFYSLPALEITPEIDTSGGTDFRSMYGYCQSLKSGKLLIPSNASAKSIFTQCRSLTDLELTVGEGVDFTGAFKNCSALVNLNIIGVLSKTGFNLQYSVNLSHDSFVSVINAYSASLSLSVTLSKTAVNKAFATTTGRTDGSTSAEWLALVATRPYLTIALE